MHKMRFVMAMAAILLCSGAMSGTRSQEGGLTAFDATTAAGHRQIVIVDGENRRLGVYHVDPASGEISLRSVRNVHWDLMMDEFSSGSPPLKEIRAMVEKK